jgi:DNA repair protein RadC
MTVRARKWPEKEQQAFDAELLAILIGSGNTEESAVELSRRIMRECGDNINELARLTIGDLWQAVQGYWRGKGYHH